MLEVGWWGLLRDVSINISKQGVIHSEWFSEIVSSFKNFDLNFSYSTVGSIFHIFVLWR